MKTYYPYATELLKHTDEPRSSNEYNQIKVYDAEDMDKIVERLRKGLKEYGLHHEGCDIWSSEPHNKCTCGFEQVLKE